MERCRYIRLREQRSFRLLKIINTARPIECSVRIFEIGSHPEYAALSYTWGNPVDDGDLGTGREWIYVPFPP